MMTGLSGRAGLLLFLLSALSCHCHAGTTLGTEVGTSIAALSQDTLVQSSFPYPDLPQAMTDPAERRSFLLLHYWDKYDFSDAALLHRVAVTEQGLVDYVALLAEHPDPAEAVQSLDAFCSRLAPYDEARAVLPRLMEKYLYDLASPLRHDALYASFLGKLLSHVPAGTDARRSRWEYQRAMAAKNNPGTPATDFVYYRPDGSQGSLHGTQASHLLLLFYDPACSTCQDMLKAMQADVRLAAAIAAGRVQVLAVYTEGDEQAWREWLPDLPVAWMAATDKGQIRQAELYDLRAMPSLYLLDKDKTVLLKDADYEAVRHAGIY